MNPENFENRLFFQGAMDLDSSPEMVENGKYGLAFNIRPYNHQTGSVGVVTNVEGNELVEYDFRLDFGANFLKVVGSRLDLKRRRVYWLIYALEAFLQEKAFVLYFDYETRQIVTVFAFDNILELHPENLIRKVDIWYDDAIGDTLLWTDGKTEPKKLNVQASVNRFNNFVADAASYPAGSIAFADFDYDPFNEALLTLPFICTNTTASAPTYDYTTGEVSPSANWRALSVGECYPPFLFKELFYQKPITPYFSPNGWFTYADANTSPATNLSGKTYQFRYKYVYFDGQESEWSPVSEAVSSVELTSGVFDEGGDVVVFNYPTPEAVQIKVPVSLVRADDLTSYLEEPHAMIARVRVCVREVPLRQAPSDWMELQNIGVEDFFRYNVSVEPIAFGSPTPGSAGTYFYNWDTVSYRQTDGMARVVTITVPYTARETLIPVDVIDTATNFYPVPNSAISQAVINNRMVWGAVSQGMDVPLDVSASMARELSFSVQSSPSNLSIEQETTNIVSWKEEPTNTLVLTPSGIDRQAVWIFDLTAPPNQADFLGQIFYNFTINLTITTVTTLPFSFTVNGQSSAHANFKELVETAIEPLLPPNWTVEVDNATGQMIIQFDFISPSTPTITGSIETPDTGITSFFKRQELLPERTYKNHSEQQFGFAFQDNAGRLTPVITGAWASLDIPHLINSSLVPVRHTVRIGNLADIDTPQDARMMHILRKRSGSYFTYLQFALSRGNCPEQSWNFRRVFYTGFLNLSVDEFTPQSFEQGEPRYLYITPNSMTGEENGAYGNIFNRRRSIAPRSREGRDGDRGQGGRTQRGGVIVDSGETPQAATAPLSENLLLDSLTPNFAPRLTPQAGDLVRFLYQANDDLEITERFESTFVVKEYNEIWNTIVIDFRELEQKEPTLAAYFAANNNHAEDESFVCRIAAEVIRTRTTSDNEFYWETAAQLSCTNGKVDINSDGDGINIFGDAYMRLRGQFVNYIARTQVTTQNFVFNDPDYSDFFESNNVGEGRPNAEVKSIQTRGNYYSSVQRDNLAIHSETTIQETDRRQLGTVYDSNLIEADNAFGRIEYLDSEGDLLHILQEDKRARVFTGRSIATELGGAERVLATQSQAFSDIAYMQGVFGISQDGISFAKAGYRKYYTDSKRGHVYRESLDGITPISSKGMERYFKTLFKNYRNSSKAGIIRGVFDDTFDEYILMCTYWKILDATVVGFSMGVMQVELPEESSYFKSFPNGFRFTVIPQAEPIDPPFRATAQGNQDGRIVSFLYNGENPVNSGPIKIEAPITEVAVFSERTGGWTTFMSYDAEWGESGIQSYHTFVDGQMYIHEFGNEDWNTFHGRQFPMSVEVHSNQSPQLTKFWLTTGIKTNTEEISMPEITTSESQSSYIPEASFEDREGTKWSEFYGEGEGSEVLEGDRLRGRWLKAKVESDGYDVNEKKVEVFGVVFQSKPSGFTQ